MAGGAGFAPATLAREKFASEPKVPPSEARGWLFPRASAGWRGGPRLARRVGEEAVDICRRQARPLHRVEWPEDHPRELAPADDRAHDPRTHGPRPRGNALITQVRRFRPRPPSAREFDSGGEDTVGRGRSGRELQIFAHQSADVVVRLIWKIWGIQKSSLWLAKGA
jgi:hypothetical protein